MCELYLYPHDLTLLLFDLLRNIYGNMRNNIPHISLNDTNTPPNFDL